MLSLILPTRREELKDCLYSIKKHTKDYEIVLVKGEKGFASKINEGIKRAKGEYIILLHDDCVVTKGWVDKLADVGSFRLREDCNTKDTWGGFINPPRYCFDSSENPDYSYWLCLSNKIAKSLIPFDEEFTEPFYQDVQMGIKISNAGYKIKCLPGKIIHHNGSGSGKPNKRQGLILLNKYGVDLC